MTKQIFTGSMEEYEKVKDNFEDFDIVYDIHRNTSRSTHTIFIYKQPENISDWDLAFLIDGFFYNVIRRGNHLECWYD